MFTSSQNEVVLQEHNVAARKPVDPLFCAALSLYALGSFTIRNIVDQRIYQLARFIQKSVY